MGQSCACRPFERKAQSVKRRKPSRPDPPRHWPAKAACPCRAADHSARGRLEFFMPVRLRIAGGRGRDKAYPLPLHNHIFSEKNASCAMTTGTDSSHNNSKLQFGPDQKSQPGTARITPPGAPGPRCRRRFPERSGGQAPHPSAPVHPPQCASCPAAGRPSGPQPRGTNCPPG